MEIPCYDRLSNQPAIVTGASKGIGRAIAIQLAKEGAPVVVNYSSSADKAEQVVEEIKSSGGQAFAYQADVSSEEQVIEMFNKAREEYGTIHILVNNAGIQKDEELVKMTVDQWQKVIDINLTGQFLCAREAVKEFINRGVDKNVSLSAGKIICMSSVHEIIPWSGRVNYAASKGGIMLLMKTIAQEYASKKIRVNSLAPGAIKTDINKEAWETPEAEQKLLELIPSKRVGEPVDVGRAAVWLASDESEYVNGSTIYVDGGMTLYPGFASGG